MSRAASFRQHLERWLGGLLRRPDLTSDHLLIAADCCDEAERELRVAAIGDEVPRAAVELDAEEVRLCSAHLRTVASRYSDAPLLREADPRRVAIEEMPVAAIALLPPATLVRQARVIVDELLDAIEGPISDTERMTWSWRLRGAQLALCVAEDEVDALQAPGAEPERTPGRPELRLVRDEESV